MAPRTLAFEEAIVGFEATRGQGACMTVPSTLRRSGLDENQHLALLQRQHVLALISQ